MGDAPSNVQQMGLLGSTPRHSISCFSPPRVGQDYATPRHSLLVPSPDGHRCVNIGHGPPAGLPVFTNAVAILRRTRASSHRGQWCDLVSRRTRLLLLWMNGRVPVDARSQRYASSDACRADTIATWRTKIDADDDMR